jgi:hypothetical protein
MYVGWAFIGKIITGDYVYFFFDFQEIGWEYVLVAVGSFIGLTNTCESLIPTPIEYIANVCSFRCCLWYYRTA